MVTGESLTTQATRELLPQERRIEAMITREDLLDMMIRSLGFENERTLAFANAMEYLDIEALIDLFNELMTRPFEED